MLSISKYENPKTSSLKRLKVFENIANIEETQTLTRNLKVNGIDPAKDQCELEQIFMIFGNLHVFDTQHQAQGELIVSYYDIRSSSAAFDHFSKVYKVHYLPDPPFEEYSDIITIYTDPSFFPRINEIFGNNSFSVAIKFNSISFRYYDLRNVWNYQALLYSLQKPSKPVVENMRIKIPSNDIEEKENIRPGFSRKNSENLTKYVIILENIIEGKDTRTTLMIKNIPNKYTQTMILDSINRNHSYKFDFMYLPIDFKNKCNVGYAFINFVSYAYIPEFYKEFDGKKWEKFNSEKVCALSYARIQGRANLEKHFQTSSIMIQEKAMRPVILSSYKFI